MGLTKIVPFIVLSLVAAGCTRMGNPQPEIDPGTATARPAAEETAPGQAEATPASDLMAPGPKVKEVAMENVLFDFGKVVPKASAKRELGRLIQFLKENPSRQVVLEGHADGTGAADYNQQLSLERAETIKRYLIKEGIKPELIIIQGFGETRPIADNSTETGRSQNRRVEIVVR